VSELIQQGRELIDLRLGSQDFVLTITQGGAGMLAYMPRKPCGKVAMVTALLLLMRPLKAEPFWACRVHYR
jgi:hypothetical protein